MRAGRRRCSRPAIVLGAAELGAAVSAGAAELTVARRPRVQVLSTGDELKAPGEPLGPGEIHNSNGPMLVALAEHQGAACPPAGRLPDDRAATEAGLASALETADVVIVSGGVSVGPHDHVKPALRSPRRRAGVLAGRAPAGQAHLVRPPRRNARVRPARQPGLGRGDVRPVRAPRPGRAPGPRRRARCSSPRRSSPPRSRATPTASRRPRPARAPGRSAHRHPERAPGLAHRHLAARRRRAGDDRPPATGELEAGATVALEPLPR